MDASDEPRADCRASLAAALCRQRHRCQRFRGCPRDAPRVVGLGPELARDGRGARGASAARPRPTDAWCPPPPRTSAPRGAITSASSSGSRTRTLHATLRDQAVAVYRRTLATSRPARGAPRDPLRGSHHPGTSPPPATACHATARAHRSRSRLLERGDVHHRGRVPPPRHGDAQHRRPGSVGELGDFAIRPNWETVITPVLDHLAALGLDSTFGSDRPDGHQHGRHLRAARCRARAASQRGRRPCRPVQPRRLLGCAQSR